MNVANALTHAFILLQQGRTAQAESAITPVLASAGSAGQHLLGLVRAAQGRLVEAEALMQRSLQDQPYNHEYWTNYGNLGREMDALGPAESRYRRALQLSPRFVPALRGLVRLLLDQSAFEQSAQLAEHLVSISRTGLAFAYWAQSLRGQRRLTQALEVCVRAQAEGVTHNSLLLEHAIILEKLGDGQAALEIYRALEANGLRDPALYVNWAGTEDALGAHDAAITQLRKGLQHSPGNVRLHLALVHALVAAGSAEPEQELLEALARQPGDFGLLRLSATLLRQLDRPQLAQNLFVVAKAAYPQNSWIDLAWAEHLDETGDPQAAAALIDQAQAVIAPTRQSLGVIAHVRLRNSAFEAALAASQQLLRLSPYDQVGLAYQWTAQKGLGRAKGSDHWVRTYDLQTPPGFASLDSFNAQLRLSLHEIHNRSQIPLGQSVRHGTQTPKSLLDSPDPTIRAFLDALAQPLQEYEAQMAQMDSPALAQRRTGRRRLSGCWSILLRPGGWHVNHVHPQGWISSAYYVETPQAPARQGWLKFGEPRYSIPGCGPDLWIEPRPGRLVLFPSFLWHGVESFTVGGERLTIAFDAVPA